MDAAPVGIALVLVSVLALTGCVTNKDVIRQMHDEELRSDYRAGRIAARWAGTERGAPGKTSALFEHARITCKN